MWGDGMNMALASYRFISKLSRRIDDHAEQQHATLQLGAVFATADVHHDRVHRVRALAFGVSQTAPDVIETTEFGHRAEDVFVIGKLEIADAMHTKFRIEFERRLLVVEFHESVLVINLGSN